MENFETRTNETCTGEIRIIQGPHIQLYNLRTHVSVCWNYLQKGKKTREIGRKGKTEN